MRVDTSTTIDAPPEKVWRVVMDPSRLDEWVSIHRAVDGAPSGPLGKGSSFVQRLGLAGRTFDVTWTVRDVEEPRCAIWDGAGPAGSHARIEYRMSPAGKGTRFHYSSRFNLPGGMFGRLAGRILSRALMRREARKSLARLKSVVEPG